MLIRTQHVLRFSRIVHDKEEDAFIFMPPGRVFVSFSFSSCLGFQHIPTFGCLYVKSRQDVASSQSLLTCPFLSYSLPPGLVPSSVSIGGSSIFTTSARRGTSYTNYYSSQTTTKLLYLWLERQIKPPQKNT